MASKNLSGEMQGHAPSPQESQTPLHSALPEHTSPIAAVRKRKIPKELSLPKSKDVSPIERGFKQPASAQANSNITIAANEKESVDLTPTTASAKRISYDFNPGPNQFSTIKSSRQSPVISSPSKNVKFSKAGTPMSGRFAHFPPSSKSADRHTFSPSIIKAATSTSLPASRATSPTVPLPDAKEVVVESTTLLFRLALDFWRLIIYLVGIPLQIISWAYTNVFNLLWKIFSVVFGTINWFYSTIDKVFGTTVDRLEDIVKKLCNTISRVFDQPVLSIVKTFISFVKNTPHKMKQAYDRLGTGANSVKADVLLVLWPLIIALLFTFVNTFDWNAMYLGSGFRLLNFDHIMIKPLAIKLIPSRHQTPLFDRVVQVANVLTDSANKYNQVLLLNDEAHALQNVYQNGYYTSLAVSETKAANANKVIVSRFKDLRNYLSSLSDTKVETLPSIHALEQVGSELRKLGRKAGSRVRGIKTNDAEVFEIILNKFLAVHKQKCVNLEHKVVEGINVLETQHGSLTDLEELLTYNHQTAIELRQRHWNGFINRLWRRWNPIKAAATFETRKAKEEWKYEEGVEALTRFAQFLKLLRETLEADDDKLRHTLDSNRKQSEKISNKYLFRGSISDKIRKIDSLVSSTQHWKEVGQKARLDLRKN